ncbi:hypothetical protein HWC49_gp83 [Gordonia phage Kenosha]|uniref:Uncharacterized protein n=1 Tax=Gordonia phage Kenosha TaxID=2588490 RepID=A0A514CXT2_9CAUD|nr:hypothetical protein HWC49_gp83 [Gordonia phage Kenosha]QDH85314.1 hypothetical protein SEA_KENOSHA_83 [Gordonia phage Kenosha]
MYEGVSSTEPMADGDYQLVSFDGDMIHIRHLCKPASMNEDSVLSLMQDGKTMFCSGCGTHHELVFVDGRTILKAV